MNKLKITAYMLMIWAALGLNGCAGTDQRQMYLEAKVREDAGGQDADDGTADGGPAEPAEQKTEDALAEAADKAVEASDGGTCFVYVCGAVNHPGVFELPQGSRVYEAVALAGGFREDAYEKSLNQAQQIADGDMIEVLTKKEQREMEKQAQASGQKPSGADAAPDSPSDGLIDINTATAQQLMTLNGIGEAKAASIIEYREKNGGFAAVEELMNVSGIGEGVYAKIQDKITVTQ